MSLSPLPPTSDFITTGETKGAFKGALSGLRAFLNSLLGADGSQATALSALGALMNGSISKTTAYMVAATDRGKMIDCTGTFDLTIDAIATLAPSGAGFAFAVANGGTGSITINPDLSETINGVATFVLGPNESCIVMTDATAAGWRAILVGSGGSAGEVAYFAMNTAPTGWLKANGAAVSRTSYAALFDAIGTTFGVGDGSSTFNLPDLRGEFPRGWDDGRGVDAGRVFGSAQAHAMQTHTHKQSFADSYVPANPESGMIQRGENAGPLVDSGPAGTSSETRPRNIALLACIKY